MTDLIAVTGAPGNIGTPLVHTLLTRGEQVRVLARRPVRAREVLGEHANLDIMRFEFGDRLTYVPAVQGVRKLFVVRPPRMGRARDLFPALDVAVGAGVSHFVLLSLLGVERLPFFPHAQLEKHLQGSGAAYTFLRPGYFLQNLTTTHLPELKRGVIAVPAAQGRTSFIDGRDIAEAAAVCLTQPGHDGKTYALTGPQALSFTELADIFSRVTGHPTQYTNPSPLAFYRELRARGVPTAQIAVMQLIYATARAGLAARVTPDLPRLLGRPARTAEDFARDELRKVLT